MTDFLALQRFVDQSLDSTRAELSQLLYPVFAHFYLKLIINGHDNAQSFYDEFSVGFGVDSPYIEDIRRLATVKNRKQLGKGFSKRKYKFEFFCKIRDFFS